MELRFKNQELKWHGVKFLCRNDFIFNKKNNFYALDDYVNIVLLVQKVNYTRVIYLNVCIRNTSSVNCI